MSTITFDWDDEDKFRAHGLYAPDGPLIQSLQPQAQEISKTSSIGQAEGKGEFRPHRPQLEPPKRHYMIDLLELHQGIERAVSKELMVFREQSKEDLAEIERLEKEKNEALRKNAEEAASRNNWTVLGNVAEYLASGTSIAVGLSLAPTGWGTFLIASGVLGLSNRIVRDTAGWQSVAAWFTKSVENQKRLVERIEMGCLAVELGTGLTGGMGAALTGSFSALAYAPRLTAARKMATTIQAASHGIGVTSRLGKTFADKRIDDFRALMKLLDAEAERIRMEMHTHATDLRSMIDTAQAVGQEMHKAIAAGVIEN